MTLLEMLDRRNQAVSEAKALNDVAGNEGRNFSKPEKVRYDGIMAEVRDLNEQITRAQELQAIETTLGTSQGTRAAHLEGAGGNFPGGGAEHPMGAGYTNQEGQAVRFLTREQNLVDLAPRGEPFDIGKALRGKVTGNWAGADAEKRALSESLDTAGGFVLPSPVAARIIDVARNMSCLLKAGAVTVPMDNSELSLAKLDTDPRAVWRHENVAITEDDLMTFSKITLTARTVATMVRMSIELLEDAPNVGPLTSNAISQAIALELDRVGMFGIGAGAEPLGIFQDTDVPVISMGVNGGQIVIDKLLEAKRTILDANGTPGAMIYAPRTWENLAKLKDGDGNYFATWPGNLSDLKQLVSNQVPVNQVQGNVATASCLFMGDFANVLLGLRTQMVLEATRTGGSDTFSKMQILVRAYLRADFAIARPTQLCTVKGIIPA